jgi:nitronate monooxygenase
MWYNMKAIQNIGYRLPNHAGTFWRRSSSVELVATVSNAGGLGAYGAYTLSPQAIR